MPKTATRQQTNPNGTGPSPGGWQLYTLANAYLPRPPIQYLVDSLFELPSLNMVYGAPSSLKSFILADMAICIATGKSWLDKNPMNILQKCTPKPTFHCPVVWVDFDNGLRRTHERFDMLGKAHGSSADIPLYYSSMAAPPLMMNDSTSVLYLASLIQSLQAKLVIIDNLGTVCGPGVDENSADMVAVMYAFRQIVESTGAAVIVIHHQRKANGFKTRAGETLRGHSSIEASLDLALLIEREPGSREIKLQSTKSRGIDVKPFGATFDIWQDQNGQDNAKFYGVFIEDTNSDDAIKQTIIDVIADNSPGINQKDLVDEVRKILDNPSINRIKRLIQALQGEDKIDSISGKGKTTLYVIP